MSRKGPADARNRRRLEPPELAAVLRGELDRPSSPAHALWTGLWRPIIERCGGYERSRWTAAVFKARWRLPGEPAAKRAASRWWCLHNVDFAWHLKTWSGFEAGGGTSAARKVKTRCGAELRLQPVANVAEDLRRYLALRGLELRDRDGRDVGLLCEVA